LRTYLSIWVYSIMYVGGRSLKLGNSSIIYQYDYDIRCTATIVVKLPWKQISDIETAASMIRREERSRRLSEFSIYCAAGHRCLPRTRDSDMDRNPRPVLWVWSFAHHTWHTKSITHCVSEVEALHDEEFHLHQNASRHPRHSAWWHLSPPS
jgi:hypothetical protein